MVWETMKDVYKMIEQGEDFEEMPRLIEGIFKSLFCQDIYTKFE
jgi:hypothetical protein